MANNYGVGGQIPYQLDYNKIATDSQIPQKNNFPDPIKVMLNNAGKTIGGVWNRFINPASAAPVKTPQIQTQNIPVNGITPADRIKYGWAIEGMANRPITKPDGTTTSYHDELIKAAKAIEEPVSDK